MIIAIRYERSIDILDVAGGIAMTQEEAKNSRGLKSVNWMNFTVRRSLQCPTAPYRRNSDFNEGWHRFSTSQRVTEGVSVSDKNRTQFRPPVGLSSSWPSFARARINSPVFFARVQKTREWPTFLLNKWPLPFPSVRTGKFVLKRPIEIKQMVSNFGINFHFEFSL